MRTLIALTALLALTFPISSFGQSIFGDLEGWIFDQQTGDAVAFATVSVSGDNLQIPRHSESRSDGFFRIKGIPVGTYPVTIQLLGYQSVIYKDVVVQLGRATSLGRTVLVQQARETEEIIVTEQRPILDFSTTESGNNLRSEVLDQLPTPRDYREVIAYLPQTNNSFLGDNMNVAGGNGSENQYFIEGVNVTYPFLGDAGTRLPQNFVREVQVKRGGYEAEYSKATGGIINVITHSGSNEFDGQVFGFLTNNNVSSDSRRGFADLNQVDFSLYDIGASLGGAIVRDKLWYFAAYNPTFAGETLEIPGLGSFEDKAVSHLFAGKLSWSVSANTIFDLAVFGDPTQHDRIGGSILVPPQETIANADPLLSDVTTGAITISLKGRHLFGDRAIVEGLVSRVETNNESRAATEIGRTEVTYADLFNGILSGGNQNQFDHHTVRRAIDLSATVFAGSHELKIGAAYEDIFLDEEWTIQTPDGEDGLVLRFDAGGTPFSWLSTTLLNDFVVIHRLPSVFLQDSWRATNRLRVNAGVRWDGIYIVNQAGEVVQSIDDGFQPRVGAIYQLDQAGHQKLSGSYARVYQQMAMIASSWYFGDYYQSVSFYDVNPLPDFTAPPTFQQVYDNSTYPSDDLDGQYLDEFTLGYENRFAGTWKAGVRGVYRDVGRVIETTVMPDNTYLLGNPGQGSMDHLPEAVRRYTALEFSLENTFGRTLNLAAWYVLSKTEGNYPGIFDTDGGNPHSHVTNQFWDISQVSEGLLPNDRTHVLKTYGSYAFAFGLTAGGFFTWQSGTPLSEYGGTPLGPNAYSQLIPRGTAGRTPSIWDASIRLAYDLSRLTGGIGSARSRLLFDVFHLFGQNEVVDIEQIHYFGMPGGGPEDKPNPNFGKVKAYQPPMTIRFGFETSF